MNEAVLCYSDTVLYKADVALLEDPTEWLNDAVINYQLKRFQCNDKDLLNVGDASLYETRTIFMDPAVLSFLMHQLSSSSEDSKQSEDEEFVEAQQALKANGILLSPPPPPSSTGASHLPRRSGRRNGLGTNAQQLVFFPINDSHAMSGYVGSPTSALGAHWSLLIMFIFEPYSLAFYHFDSSHHMNENAAIAVAKKMSTTLTGGAGSAELDFYRCASPIQENENDCGLYCLAMVECLASDFLRRNLRLILPQEEVANSSVAVDPRRIQRQLEGILKDSSLYQKGSQYASEYRRLILQSIESHIIEKKT